MAGGVRGTLYPFASMIGGTEVESVAFVEVEEPCVDGDVCMVTISSGDLVKGRLREHVEYCEKVLHAPEPILRIIREGYFLPLVHEPQHYHRCNHSSAFVHESVCYRVGCRIGCTQVH